VAEEVGENQVVSAYFNDKEEGEDYDDDESSAKTTSVTGFKVGVELTSGHDWVKDYHDQTTADGGCGGSITDSFSLYSSQYGHGEETEEDTRVAKWEAIVVPTGTPMKGKVKINGKATGNGLAKIKVWDEDGNDDGNHSVSIGVSYIVSFQYTYSWEGDECVATGSGGVAFQSDSGWLATKSTKISDVSDNTEEWKENEFSHTAPTTYYICNVGEFKRANFMLGGQLNCHEEDADDANGIVEANVSYTFTIIEWPEYVP